MNKAEKWKIRAIFWLLGGVDEIGTTQEYAEISRKIIGGMIKR